MGVPIEDKVNEAFLAMSSLHLEHCGNTVRKHFRKPFTLQACL